MLVSYCFACEVHIFHGASDSFAYFLRDFCEFRFSCRSNYKDIKVIFILRLLDFEGCETMGLVNVVSYVRFH